MFGENSTNVPETRIAPPAPRIANLAAGKQRGRPNAKSGPCLLDQDQLAGVTWSAGVRWKNLAIHAPKCSREALGILVASFVDASALVAD